MAIIQYLTNLGDLAVLLPLSALVLAWLLFRPRWDAAFWWVLSVALCSAATAILKIFNNACPDAISANTSGHTSLSLLVYGAIFLLVSARYGKWQRAILASAGIALALAIAVSRVLVGAHSITEVVIGMTIGSASLAIFLIGFRRTFPVELPIWPLAVPAILVVLLLNGHQLETADIFQSFGGYLHQIGICG